jgi:hypothetical protein
LYLVAACSGAGSSSKTTDATSTVGAPVAPAAGNLYQPPADMHSAPPGTRIWTQLFAQRAGRKLFGVPTSVWLMLYHSRDRAGRDIAVSGFAVVPNGRAPAEGRPVYAWAHGDVGLGDACAPSKRIAANLPAYGADQVARGAVLVATDYEGLGTPGEHPYLVGDSEAHAVLDSIRAAASLPNVGRIGDVVIAGFGEGGHATLFAAERAKAYAPDIRLRGVVAVAPDAELPAMLASSGGPDYATAVMTAAGLTAAYPEFDPSTFLTPTAVADLPRVRGACAASIATRYSKDGSVSPLSRDPDAVPAVRELLVENSPAGALSSVPVLLVQGNLDTRASRGTTASLLRKYCALGSSVERLVAHADRTAILDAGRTRVLRWIDARFAGRRARSGCR